MLTLSSPKGEPLVPPTSQVMVAGPERVPAELGAVTRKGVAVVRMSRRRSSLPTPPRPSRATTRNASVRLVAGRISPGTVVQVLFRMLASGGIVRVVAVLPRRLRMIGPRPGSPADSENPVVPPLSRWSHVSVTGSPSASATERVRNSKNTPAGMV